MLKKKQQEINLNINMNINQNNTAKKSNNNNNKIDNIKKNHNIYASSKNVILHNRESLLIIEKWDLDDNKEKNNIS